MSEDRPRYLASIFFKNEASMQAYRERDTNTRVLAFQAAKSAREYLFAEK